MTLLTEPRRVGGRLPVTALAPIIREYEARLKDKTYRQHPVGQDVGRYLRALRWSDASQNTLDTYELALARLALDHADFDSLERFCSPAGTEYLREFLNRHWAEASSATRANRAAIVRSFFTVEDDGLALLWRSERWRPTVFVNPPYSKAREPWVRRCIDAGEANQKVVLLIPAATDTRIFQAAALSADAVVFVRGRLKFGTLRPNRRQHAASHPSALLGWNTKLEHCRSLGWAT